MASPPPESLFEQRDSATGVAGMFASHCKLADQAVSDPMIRTQCRTAQFQCRLQNANGFRETILVAVALAKVALPEKRRFVGVAELVHCPLPSLIKVGKVLGVIRELLIRPPETRKVFDGSHAFATEVCIS